MCYLVRQQQPEAQAGGVAQPPRGFDATRPRWAGAAALTLLGGLAVAAALVTTPSMAPQLQGARESGAVLPVAAQSPSRSTTGGGAVEQTSLPMDDGVPSSGTDVVKAGAGHCHHGL